MGEPIIPLLLVGLIGYVLYKRGKLRVVTVTKIAYVYKQFGHKLSISYKKFHGFDYYYFSFHPGDKVTLTYEVTVEEGTLCLEWRDRKELAWKKTFTADEQGTYTFTAKRRLHSLRVDGKQTKGGCRIEFSR